MVVAGAVTSTYWLPEAPSTILPPVTGSRAITVRGLSPLASSTTCCTGEPETREMAALSEMSRPECSSTRSLVAATPSICSAVSAVSDSPDHTASNGAS